MANNTRHIYLDLKLMAEDISSPDVSEFEILALANSAQYSLSVLQQIWITNQTLGDKDYKFLQVYNFFLYVAKEMSSNHNSSYEDLIKAYTVLLEAGRESTLYGWAEKE